jgi:hypothetical protein
LLELSSLGQQRRTGLDRLACGLPGHADEHAESPLATDSSATRAKSSISLVLRQCVPPQNSIEYLAPVGVVGIQRRKFVDGLGPIGHDAHDRQGYFSPKTARRPLILSASSCGTYVDHRPRRLAGDLLIDDLLDASRPLRRSAPWDARSRNASFHRRPASPSAGCARRGLPQREVQHVRGRVVASWSALRRSMDVIARPASPVLQQFIVFDAADDESPESAKRCVSVMWAQQRTFRKRS